MAEQLTRRYVLEHVLGRGGMGEVFAGRALGREGFSRPVAIKRLHARYSDDRALLVTEARLTAGLLHQNIVTVFDLDQDEAGRMFLVMELIDGSDLASLLRAGALPVPCALFIACEILRGLGYAHERRGADDIVRGFVHRDVSPQNVLIGWDGSVKVSDFGLAKVRLAAQASASIFVRGKPGYMSPEQADGDALDGRSDLFSAGIMLWEMLCGRRLFGSGTKLTNLLLDAIPSPRVHVPELPEEIEHITMRLLARDLGERYPAADAVVAELQACAAFPKNGHEQIAGLLRARDRDPTRALHESDSGAGSGSEVTVSVKGAPGVARPLFGEPFPVLGEPFPDPPELGRARRRGLLAALAVATALATVLMLSSVLGGDDTEAPAVLEVPAARPTPAVAPVSPPQPPSPPRDEERVVTPSEPPSPAVLAVLAPSPSPPPPRKPSGGRSPSRKRPSPTAASSDGMRVIDLRDLGQMGQTAQDERREDPR